MNKDWSKRLAWATLIVMVFIAIFAEFIANDAPIIGRDSQGNWVSWIWMTDAEIESSVLTWRIDPLIRFDANDIDLRSARYRPPLSLNPEGERHWLGTDLIGRDIAAGMIYGCRLSLMTAILATFLALLIGIPAGMYSGYFGDRRLSVTPSKMIIWLALLLVLTYQFINFTTLATGMHAILLILSATLLLLSTKACQKGKYRIHIPLDTLFTRLIELMISLPGLIVLLAISAAIDNKSLAITAVIIGVLRWVRIGQVSRNETIRWQNEAFVQSAKALGLSNQRIIWKHILPNLWGPILVIAVFSLGGFILLESSLSFLGIGVALEEQTWGSMLSEARRNIEAWWLAIFPGLAIFLAIVSVNTIGQDLRQQRG